MRRQGVFVWSARGWVPQINSRRDLTCFKCGAQPAIIYHKDGFDHCEGCKPE